MHIHICVHEQVWPHSHIFLLMKLPLCNKQLLLSIARQAHSRKEGKMNVARINLSLLRSQNRRAEATSLVNVTLFVCVFACLFYVENVTLTQCAFSHVLSSDTVHAECVLVLAFTCLHHFRIFLVCVMECMRIHTGSWFILSTEGDEGCCPCTCSGVKLLTRQLGWRPVPEANEVKIA